MRDFDVSVSDLPDRTVVHLAGELDMDTCPWVTQVTDALTLHGRTLLLDFSNVSFMDSSSLNMLLRLRQRVHAENGALELCGLQEQARQVLELTGTHVLFPYASTTKLPGQRRPEERADRPAAVRHNR